MTAVSSLNQVERHVNSTHFQKSLAFLLTHYGGIEVDIFASKTRADDVYTDVYGIEAASPEDIMTPTDRIKVLITGNGYTDIGNLGAGILEKAFLYTEDSQVQVGSVIQIVREDNLIVRFLVKEYQVKGVTIKVSNLFAISSYGE